MKKFLESRSKLMLKQIKIMSVIVSIIVFVALTFIYWNFNKEPNFLEYFVTNICYAVISACVIFMVLGGVTKLLDVNDEKVKNYVLNLFNESNIFYEFKLIPYNGSGVTKTFLTLIENGGIRFYAMLLENENIQIIAKNIDDKIIYNSTCTNYYFQANFKFVTNDSR